MDTKNPRNNPKHRERGPKRFHYTYADIAQLVGAAEHTVKNAAAGPAASLDPADLGSVLRYAEARRGLPPMLLAYLAGAEGASSAEDVARTLPPALRRRLARVIEAAETPTGRKCATEGRTLAEVFAAEEKSAEDLRDV